MTAAPFAFFEFAPTSGAGMSAACAGTTITGAKGEALTFTRTGNATCSKQGLATTGINNGDLVVLADNIPRVEPSGGVLGLRVESARTNVGLRSQEFNNAVWVPNGIGVAAPTVTANQATAPDGTLTADRIQFAATTAVQGATVYQVETHSLATYSVSLYVKGNGSSGTLDVCLYNGTTHQCTACAFVSASWTRCTHSSTSVAGAGAAVVSFGNASSYTGNARDANDVFVWGGQAELGAYATSYIPTVAAAVTRNAERAYFSRSVPTTVGVCSAATHEVPSTTVYAAGSGLYAPLLSQLSGSAGSPYMWPYTGGTGTALAIDGTGSTGAPSGWAPAATNTSLTARYVAGHNGTAWTICKDAVCSSNGVASAWSSPTYLFIKLDASATSPEAAIWSRVQVDPAFSRCSP